MTIKELYDWAKREGVENLPIGLQFMDEGGDYRGNTYTEFGDIIKIGHHVRTAEDGKSYVLIADY